MKKTVHTDTRLSLKQWAEADRPREKLMAKGIMALSDAELLAILIGSGNTEETAVELSRRILNECSNNLNELARLSINDLQKRFKGIGTAKAISIVAALELGRRRKNNTELKRPQIKDSETAFTLFHPVLCDLPHEEVWIALLNRQNQVISLHKIGQGGLDGSIADIRLIVKLALETNASALLLAHNHPSGNTAPSTADTTLTKRVKDGCNLFDIKLLDHIIVAHNRKYSFADEGML